MTYVYPAWEFAADSLQVKLQRLQNKILGTTGTFTRHTLIRDLQMAFKLPYIYYYITKSCSQQQVIQNPENAHVPNIAQGEPRHRKYMKHILGSGQAYDRSSD
jgi:hypothetical protein